MSYLQRGVARYLSTLTFAHQRYLLSHNPSPPLPEAAGMKAFVAPVTQPRQPENRNIGRIHCRSSIGVYLPRGRSWRALLRRQSQAVLSKFRALIYLAVAAS